MEPGQNDYKPISLEQLSESYNEIVNQNHQISTTIKNQLHDIQLIINNQNNHINIYRDIIKKLSK